MGSSSIVQQQGHRQGQQTHPLLLMPVHLQGRSAAPPCPPGHEGVLVIPKHHLFLLGRGGGGLGSDVVGPCCIQAMDGAGQQLTVTDSDQLPGLWVHKPGLLSMLSLPPTLSTEPTRIAVSGVPEHKGSM